MSLAITAEGTGGGGGSSGWTPANVATMLATVAALGTALTVGFRSVGDELADPHATVDARCYGFVTDRGGFLGYTGCVPREFAPYDTASSKSFLTTSIQGVDVVHGVPDTLAIGGVVGMSSGSSCTSGTRTFNWYESLARVPTYGSRGSKCVAYTTLAEYQLLELDGLFLWDTYFVPPDTTEVR